jgi:hypothetical protein
MPQPGEPARTQHWEILLISCGVIAAAAALRVTDGGRVALGGPLSATLPPTCFSREVLGVPCPGCGLTRSFVHLAHGRWAASLEAHRVGWVLALTVCAQIPYRLWRLAHPDRRAWSAGGRKLFAGALAALLVGNWAAGLVLGF